MYRDIITITRECNNCGFQYQEHSPFLERAKDFPEAVELLQDNPTTKRCVKCHARDYQNFISYSIKTELFNEET